ncbi:metallophosphoesterase family protein [Lacihabitans lacunae]|uniref:Phosphoesterase n=1 Tax=Lacihabitans lacunae TaxID=1028214 RepID=A0ABV7YSH8_9BACT
MTRIGLISDTHSYLDPLVFDYFENCDEIWHLGDIGSESIITELQNFKPLRVVYGNIDTPYLQKTLPEVDVFDLEGLKVMLIHIGAIPPRYNPKIKALLKKHTPNLFLCGHSHILKVIKDPNTVGLVYINPGAAGKHGFHHVRTLMKMELHDGKVVNLEVNELGKR